MFTSILKKAFFGFKAIIEILHHFGDDQGSGHVRLIWNRSTGLLWNSDGRSSGELFPPNLQIFWMGLGAECSRKKLFILELFLASATWAFTLQDLTS